jgi:hypothetical protein
MIAHSSRSSALFLDLLTPNVFRSSSTQSSHLNLGLPGFLLPTGFPRNTFFTNLSSSILITWPAHASRLTLMDVTISALLYWSCNSLFLRILYSFVSLFGPYTFRKRLVKLLRLIFHMFLYYVCRWFGRLYIITEGVQGTEKVRKRWYSVTPCGPVGTY